ncbi:MAG: serine/threonine-protein phosphatase [Bacteroidales bacterium]|nr:serine/threonine-protein phosphatase [Bacteroidales bacterium]
MVIHNQSYSMQELGQRKNQEDSIFPKLSDKPQESSLYILCDGMGGHERGEVASGCVCEAMGDYFEKSAGMPSEGNFDAEDFKKVLTAAYDALDALDDGSEKKMGTTLAFLKFHEGGAFLAHIGDSRIYHIRPSENKILHVTRDHSLVNELIDIGELTPEEAVTSPQKNIITKAMQPNQEKRCAAECFNISDIEPDDYFFLCSDGVLEGLADNQLCNILCMKNTSDKDKLGILKKVTRENKDNHSAHLIRVISVDEKSQNSHWLRRMFLFKNPKDYKQ